MVGCQNTYYGSTLDSLYPPIVQNWILCFPCKGSAVQDVAGILRRGFAETLRELPQLTGRLDREDSHGSHHGRLRLIYDPEEGAHDRFLVNDLTERRGTWATSYDTLRGQGMPVAALSAKHLIPPLGKEVLDSLPIVAQANFIPGGCLLGICLNHSLFDGAGAANVAGVWAAKCKSLQQRPDSAPGNSSDSRCEQEGEAGLIKDGSADVRPSVVFQLPSVFEDVVPSQGLGRSHVELDGKLWELLGLQQPPLAPATEWARTPPKEMLTAIFSATSASIGTLKRISHVSDDDSGEATARPSSFEAIAAMMWQSIMRARSPDFEAAKSRLRIPVSQRKTLGISDHHPGNVLLNAVAELPLDTVLAKNNEQQLATKIRESVAATRRPHRVYDALKLSHVLPELVLRRPLFPDTTREDLVLTSWQDLPYYKHDWGPMFGAPGVAEFCRIPHGALPGLCALQPRSHESTVEVLVSLKREQMARLSQDTEFARFFRLVSV